MAELQRTLGFWMTSAFIFLNLVNTGVFFGVAIAASVAGPDSLIAWCILAIMSVYTAMCFAELTTMFPQAGGVYEFAKRAYGRFFSFQVGWIIWVINNVATALLIVAALDYVLPSPTITLLGLTLTGSLTRSLIAIGVIIILNYIAYRGADDSARLMVVLAAFTLVLGGLVVVPGFFAMATSNFLPLTWDWPVILLAAFLLSETFFGWESISFMAEEIKDPERTIPRALISTTIFVAIISVAIAIITIGVLGIDRLASGEVTRPIIDVLSQLGFGKWMLLLANIGIVVTFLGNAAGGIIGNPRLLMALARDKLFISQFSDIHPRHQTPYRGIILQTIAAIIIVLLAQGAYQSLLQLVVAPSIILYVSMLILVPLFRFTLPQQARPYRAPFGKWLPVLLVSAYLGLLIMWAIYDAGAVAQLRILANFVLFSIPIYILLTYFYDPDVIITTMNRFAFLNLWFEGLLVPRRLREEILTYVPDAKDHTILELGAGVGSLTIHLADHVGKGGKIYAIDFSHHNIRTLQSRLAKLGHTHVTAIHDPHLVSRVHPQIPTVDEVVSIGTLSYIQDAPKVLRELYHLLEHRGKICFVEYTDFFGILPNNPKWLSHHDEIRELFAKAGFAVNVTKRRGLLWNYTYIYGFREKASVPYI